MAMTSNLINLKIPPVVQSGQIIKIQILVYVGRLWLVWLHFT